MSFFQNNKTLQPCRASHLRKRKKRVTKKKKLTNYPKKTKDKNTHKHIPGVRQQERATHYTCKPLQKRQQKRLKKTQDEFVAIVREPEQKKRRN
jgi:hypothetical protein